MYRITTLFFECRPTNDNKIVRDKHYPTTRYTVCTDKVGHRIINNSLPKYFMYVCTMICMCMRSVKL